MMSFQSLLDNPQASAYDAVLVNAKTYIKGDFAEGWRKALHDGWVEGTAFTAGAASPKGGAGTTAPMGSSGGYEISFKPDTSLYDGRYGNVGWLQELSKQVTSMSWDNAALMSMGSMADLKVDETELIEITLDGRKVTAPVLMAPGHPDGAITLHLGFGRRVEAGRVGAGVGFDAYKLRKADMPLYAAGATAKKVDGSYDLCVTKVHNIEHRGSFAQHDLEHPLSDKTGTYSLAGHEAMERAIIRYATLEEAKKNPAFAHEEGGPGSMIDKVGYSPQGETPGHGDSFFPDAWNYKKTDPSSRKIQNAWGMAIDLNSCIGCNACVVSCYAENNIAVVGREQVKVGRNMQWIRVDTYFEGDLHSPKAHFQPMACQHCENAGCEQVCPVGATVHTPEGLNTMVYNRCVGTRYLLEQLPVQGAPVQLPAVLGLRHGEPEVHAQPGRVGALARRDGEVQLLRAAHPGSEDHGRQREPRDPRRRHRRGLPAGLPHLRDHLRQHQRSRQQGSQAQGDGARLPGAVGPELQAAHHLHGWRHQTRTRSWHKWLPRIHFPIRPAWTR